MEKLFEICRATTKEMVDFPGGHSKSKEMPSYWTCIDEFIRTALERGLATALTDNYYNDPASDVPGVPRHRLPSNS